LTTSLMISSLITGQLSSIFQKGRNLQILLDFYAGCQWNSFAYKMASLSLHQNPQNLRNLAAWQSKVTAGSAAWRKSME
jgi:hypothetical protein